MWCRKCYTSNEDVLFHIADEENLYVGEGDEDRLVAGWNPRPSDSRKHSEARDGDDLMTSFECDYCVFSKITGRVSDRRNDKDLHLMACIRRVILDAFWSRARQTVTSNASRFREMMSLSLSLLGFEPPYDPPGPLPSFDHCGYRVAVLMVESLNSGRHSGSYTQ